MDCPFDDPPQDRVFYEDDLVRCLWDGFPVSDGHALVITRRHIPTWFDATSEELTAVVHAVERAKQEIEKTRQPDGYNVGTNVGKAAGQTVPHFHVHVIPRYRGDSEDPRGGVRHVLPERAAYWEK